MNLDQIREQLKDRIPSRVAEATGLHVNTIRNIRDGVSSKPGYEVVEKIRQYLEAQMSK